MHRAGYVSHQPVFTSRFRGQVQSCYSGEDLSSNQLNKLVKCPSVEIQARDRKSALCEGTCKLNLRLESADVDNSETVHCTASFFLPTSSSSSRSPTSTKLPNISLQVHANLMHMHIVYKQTRSHLRTSCHESVNTDEGRTIRI